MFIILILCFGLIYLSNLNKNIILWSWTGAESFFCHVHSFNSGQLLSSANLKLVHFHFLPLHYTLYLSSLFFGLLYIFLNRLPLTLIHNGPHIHCLVQTVPDTEMSQPLFQFIHHLFVNWFLDQELGASTANL